MGTSFSRSEQQLHHKKYKIKHPSQKSLSHNKHKRRALTSKLELKVRQSYFSFDDQIGMAQISYRTLSF